VTGDRHLLAGPLLSLLAVAASGRVGMAGAAEADGSQAQSAGLEQPTSFAPKAWAALGKAGLGKRDLPPEWLAPGPRKRPAELAARDVHEVTSVKTGAGAALVFVAGTTLASPATTAAPRLPFAEVWSVARGAEALRSPLDMKRFRSASASAPAAKAGKAAKEVLVVHLEGDAGQRWELWHAKRHGSAAAPIEAKAFASHEAARSCSLELLACTATVCDGPDVEFECPLNEAEIAAQRLGVGAWRAVVRFVQDGKGAWPSVASSRIEYGIAEAQLPAQQPELARLLRVARPDVGVLRAQQKQEARTTVRAVQHAAIFWIASKNDLTATGPVLIVSEETPKAKGKGTRVVNKAYAFDAAGTSVVAKGVLSNGVLASHLEDFGRSGKLLATDVETTERVTEEPAPPLEYKNRSKKTTTRRLWFVRNKTFQSALEVEIESHGPVLCAGDAEGCQEDSRDTTWTVGQEMHNGLPDLEFVAHEHHDVMLMKTITTRYQFNGQVWDVVGEDTTGD
jgi:hypothetical protein